MRGVSSQQRRSTPYAAFSQDVPVLPDDNKKKLNSHDIPQLPGGFPKPIMYSMMSSMLHCRNVTKCLLAQSLEQHEKNIGLSSHKFEPLASRSMRIQSTPTRIEISRNSTCCKKKTIATDFSMRLPKSLSLNANTPMASNH